MKTIKHNRYDGNGNITETFEVPVKPSNEDTTNIYITEDFLRGLVKHTRQGDTGFGDYTNIGKTVWYRAEGKPDRQITSMAYKHQGDRFDVDFVQPDGQKIETSWPVK